MTAQQIVVHLEPSTQELAALRQQAAQLAALGRHTAARACDASITALEDAIREEIWHLVHHGGWRPQRARTVKAALRLLGIALEGAQK
jgi:hypothetical protein